MKKNKISFSSFFSIFFVAFWVAACGDTKPNLTNSNAQPMLEEFKPILAEDYGNSPRSIWQKPEVILDRLGDVSEKTVVDLGAGEGYFTFRLITKAKKVLAIDIGERYLSYIDSLKGELQPAFRARLQTRLASRDDANLQPNEADAVVIVNTYIYLPNRIAYLKRLKKGIAIGGKILIVDYKDRKLPVGPPAKEKVALANVEKELAEAGFKKVLSDDVSLEYQYIVTAVNE